MANFTTIHASTCITTTVELVSRQTLLGLVPRIVVLAVVIAFPLSLLVEGNLLKLKKYPSLYHHSLEDGRPVRSLIGKVDAKELAALQLLTSKPILYVCNVLESEATSGNGYSQVVEQKATSEGANVVIISSKIDLADSLKSALAFLKCPPAFIVLETPLLVLAPKLP